MDKTPIIIPPVPVPLPPSVTTDEDRLRCCIRMHGLQMAADARNLDVLRDKGLTGAALERERWNFIIAQAPKVAEVSREICRVRPIVFPNRLKQAFDSNEPSYVCKLEARADKRWDLDLADHPLLTVPKIQVDVSDPYEDFDTYAEVDVVADRLARSGAQVDWTALDADEEAYVWKAKTSTGSFVHRGVAQNTAASATGIVCFGGYATEEDDAFNNNDWAGWLFFGAATIYIAQYKVTSLEASDNWAGASVGVPYYLTWNRAGAVVTGTIRITSHTGAVQDVLSMNDDGVERTIAMPASVRWWTGGRSITGWFKNWDWLVSVVYRRRIEGY